MPLDPGTIVSGRYRVDRLVAASGMADVYAATDQRLDRPIALKVLRGAAPTDHARFARESAILAQLEHPNLVRLYDAGEHGATSYLVLELVDGPTLAAQLAEAGGPLDAATVQRVLHDLAAALAYVHDHDVVHRDLKPSNVMFDADGRVRLTDFGIARLNDATPLTATAATFGTAAYMAPEQVRGEPVGAPADVYSLGLLVLECVTGTRAFPGPPAEAAVARLSHDPVVPDGLDADRRSLLVAMTARDPADRPTAAEVARASGAAVEMPVQSTADAQADDAPPDDATVADAPALAAAAGAVAPTAAMTAAMPTAPPPRAPTRPSREPYDRHRLAGALAVLTLALIVGVAIAFAGGSANSPFLSDDSSTATTVAPAVANLFPATTAAQATTAPAPPPTTAGPDCAALQAQRDALDAQGKGAGPGHGAEKAADDQKKALDQQLRACR